MRWMSSLSEMTVCSMRETVNKMEMGSLTGMFGFVSGHVTLSLVFSGPESPDTKRPAERGQTARCRFIQLEPL